MRLLSLLFAIAWAFSAQAVNRTVLHTAVGAADGTSWADAYTTLSAALTASAAGDVVWVSNNHAGTTNIAITITSPGTPAAPVQILCVNDSAYPPTALATTATVSTTGSSSIDFTGFAYCYGISFSVGSGSVSAGLNFISASPWWWKFEKCSLRLLETGSATTARIFVGANSNTSDDQLLELIDTTIGFGNVAQTINPRARIIWQNTSSALIGTIPTTLFLQLTGNCGPTFVNGVDLSAMITGKNLVDLNGIGFAPYVFQDCKLGNGLAQALNASRGQGGIDLTLINCDSNDTKVAYYKQNYQGVITTDAVVFRTDGASDGLTPISRRMVSSANTKFYSPLESDPIVIYNTSTNSTTLKIAIVTDAITLTDADVWVTTEYQGTSGSTKSTFINDKAADVLATPANQTTDATSVWTTTGFVGTPIKQELSVTFTPAGRGIIRSRVKLARPSTTNWFCPKAIITQ